MTDTQTRPDQQTALPSRGRSVPLWIGVAVYAAAMAMWGLRAAVGHVPALVAIAAATAIAVLIVRPRTDAGRRPALAAVGAAALWTMLFAAFGWSWLLTALWASALGALWPAWRRHLAAIAAQQNNTAPALPPEVEIAFDVIDRWNTNVAAEGTLKGTRLAVRETNGRVHKCTAHLRPGKQTYSQLLAQKELIASAMMVPEPNIIIERGSTAAEALVTIITDTRNGKPVMYTGPRFNPATGLVGVGRYADDDSEAFLSIIAANGSFGATFCGDQGSGKSAAMEQMALSLLASGYFVGVYIDPQDGYSSPALMQACKYKATSVEEAAKVIRQLPLLRRVRQIIFKKFGWNGYTLSKKHPVILVIIDEFQEVANELSSDDQAILVKMAKTFRKIGAAFIVGTQTIGVQSFGGNSDLREQLMSRNVVYFYTSSKVQGRLSGNNEFDPSTLPSGTPGYGYLKEIKINGQLITRAAPFRAYHLGDKDDFDGRNPGVVWAERLKVDNPFADMPPEEAGALAAAFADLDTDHAFKALADRNLLEACRSVGLGEMEPGMLPIYAAPLPKPGAAVPQPASGIGLPSLRLGGPDEEPADQYPEKTQAILDALRAGAWGTAEIRRRAATAGVDVSSSHVEQTLPKLIDEGKAVKIATGHYHAAEAEKCERPGCGG